MPYVLLCAMLGAPLIFGGVIFWVDVLERAFTRWHEDYELARARRLHPTGRR